MTNMKLSSITTGYTTPFEATNTLESAMHLMREKSISSVVIVDSDNYPIGIFTEHDALKIISSNLNTNIEIQEIMTKNVFVIKEDTYIHDAYVLMEQRNYRHIIVVDNNGKYIGIITEGDFLRHMGFEEISKIKAVSDAMSESILTISSDISVTQAASLMTEKRCDYAVIVNDGIPKGIVKERDITHHFIENKTQVSLSVSMLSRQQMHIINKDTSLSDASDMLKEHGVHQLIVEDETNHLIGLITRHDILKAIHGSYFDYLLETIRVQSENEKTLIKHKEELEKLANYDQLTNLPNRLFFQTYLKKSISKALRNKHTLGVILLDIDRFKDINDSYGHTIGDELLKIISKRLLDRVRDGDLVAKIGGDEFAIILEDLTNAEDITNVTQDILKTIAEPCTLSNCIQVHMEASAGVVLAPNDAKSVEQAIQYADSALYQAKADGRGIYKFYTDEMTKKAMQKIAYETALRNALKNEELELYYQPQVDIKTGEIIATEALLRWNFENNGYIPPDIFIPIAEDTGLINEIGKWVINEACKQGKEWQDKGYDITIAVNISPNQVKYQDLTSIIFQALQKSDFSASKLEIEITESSLMQREEEVVEMFHTLKEKGIRLAIDDFGTGYSSLSYLKKFPIDVLKIDKSFIDNLSFGSEHMAIVTAIIEMGKALDYQVLAEGVEYQKQLDFLSEKGCHLYQGYIKSKPVPTMKFEKLLNP